MYKLDSRTNTEGVKTKLPGPDFIAPDGGWGWMVVLAAGASNLCILPVLQQFGLLFRDKFAQIEISNSEMTTIINVHVALTSCVGLANGPMFRRFTYRAVSLFGASLIVTALLLTSIANSFITYLLSFSILYGSGVGICMSANALALNTYFCKRRRSATALSWTVTALGPIIMPHIITLVLELFGVQNTMLLAAGLALHAVAFAMLLQPAQRYSKHKQEIKEIDEGSKAFSNKDLYIRNDKENDYSYCNTPSVSRRSRSIFSSQYLYNDDSNYDIIDTATPMLSKANDGWYSSEKPSLASSKLSLTSSKKFHMNDSQNLSKKPSFVSLADSRSKKTSITNLSEVRSRKNSVNLMVPEQKFKRQKSQSVTSATIEEAVVDGGSIDNNNMKNNLTEIRSRKGSISLMVPEQKLKRQRSHSGTSPAIDEVVVVDDGVSSNIKNEIRSRKSSTTLPDQKHKRQKHQSITIKIEESEVEDCPSNKAPQDLKDNEKSHLLEKEKIYTPENPDNTINAKSNDGINYEKKYSIDNSSIKSGKYPEEQKSKKVFNIENDVLKEASKKLEVYAAACNMNRNNSINYENHQLLENGEDCEKEEEIQHSFWQKVIIFFDLDLLRDFTYVNLMLGITFANFAELNFSILTPFVLGDFGLDKSQVATAMSLLGGMDILVRFFIPFLAEFVGWENKTFFIFGVMGMAMGRVVIAHSRSYPVILCAAAWIGLNKALRTVFMALVLPSHVPLQRLPAATGLQLLSAGLLYPTAGPLVGWIRDVTNYSVTLHCLNIMTYMTAISWLLEELYRKRIKSRM